MGIGIPLADGSWVNQNVANTVEMIRDHYPDLEVLWIPREQREAQDAAFAIVDRTTGQAMFYVQNEEDMNYGVVDRIARSDNSRGNTYERAVKEAAQQKRYMADDAYQKRQELMEPYIHQLKKEVD